MTAKRIVVVLVFALAVYFALIGYRGVYLLTQSSLELKALGGAVLVLPLVGLWVVVAELRFGQATQRLGRQLDAEGEPPDPELPRTAAGRIERAAADALFAQRRVAVEADPEQWRGWFRLAVAYDLAGDRKRARAAMRTAIEFAEPK
jgi:Flp pilus assembly protein TadD